MKNLNYKENFRRFSKDNLQNLDFKTTKQEINVDKDKLGGCVMQIRNYFRSRKNITRTQSSDKVRSQRRP